MAVIIKYVVERDGVEKMTFSSKKEADAYDKMLDIADQLQDWLQQSPLQLDDEQTEALALHLAEQKDELLTLLKGAPAAKKSPKKPQNPEAELKLA